MPILVLFLLMTAAAALGYVIVLNVAHNAIARGASPETTALRFLPEAVRRHAHERLLPGIPFVVALPPVAWGTPPSAGPARRAAVTIRTRQEIEAGKRALRRAVRADMPIHARVLAFVGWMAVLALIALTLTALMWLVLTYIASVFNRAIRT